MKSLISRVSAVLIALAAFGAGGVALAGELPKFSNCAWPVMQSSEGLGNYLGGPDEQARYWLTPFDRKYQTMEIRGRFPHSRYFSIVAYNGNDRALPASTAGHFYDAMIAPDPGSANPYRQSTSSRRPTGAPVGDAYTIYVTRGKDIPGAANVIKVTEHDAWVYVRIYVPSPVDSLSGTAFTGGVPLPTLKLYEPGKAVPEVMKPCPVDAPEPAQDFYPVRAINKFSDVRALLQHFFPSRSRPEPGERSRRGAGGRPDLVRAALEPAHVADAESRQQIPCCVARALPEGPHHRDAYAAPKCISEGWCNAGHALLVDLQHRLRAAGEFRRMPVRRVSDEPARMAHDGHLRRREPPCLAARPPPHGCPGVTRSIRSGSSIAT